MYALLTNAFDSPFPINYYHLDDNLSIKYPLTIRTYQRRSYVINLTDIPYILKNRKLIGISFDSDSNNHNFYRLSNAGAIPTNLLIKLNSHDYSLFSLDQQKQFFHFLISSVDHLFPYWGMESNGFLITQWVTFHILDYYDLRQFKKSDQYENLIIVSDGQYIKKIPLSIKKTSNGFHADCMLYATKVTNGLLVYMTKKNLLSASHDNSISIFLLPDNKNHLIYLDKISHRDFLNRHAAEMGIVGIKDNGFEHLKIKNYQFSFNRLLSYSNIDFYCITLEPVAISCNTKKYVKFACSLIIPSDWDIHAFLHKNYNYLIKIMSNKTILRNFYFLEK